jgi:hypothetical protein
MKKINGRITLTDLLMIAPIGAIGGLAYHYLIDVLLHLSFNTAAGSNAGADKLIMSFLLTAIAAIFIVPLSALLACGLCFALMKSIKIFHSLLISAMSGGVIAITTLALLFRGVSTSLAVEVGYFIQVVQIAAIITILRLPHLSTPRMLP